MADDPRNVSGWEQHAREQQQARLKLSYRQRIDWLWQAKLFVEKARQAFLERKAKDTKSQDP